MHKQSLTLNIFVPSSWVKTLTMKVSVCLLPAALVFCCFFHAESFSFYAGLHLHTLSSSSWVYLVLFFSMRLQFHNFLLSFGLINKLYYSRRASLCREAMAVRSRAGAGAADSGGRVGRRQPPAGASAAEGAASHDQVN